MILIPVMPAEPTPRPERQNDRDKTAHCSSPTTSTSASRRRTTLETNDRFTHPRTSTSNQGLLRGTAAAETRDRMVMVRLSFVALAGLGRCVCVRVVRALVVCGGGAVDTKLPLWGLAL